MRLLALIAAVSVAVVSAVACAARSKKNASEKAAGSTGGESGCPLFTADDAWNADVSGRAVNTKWTNQINALVGAVNIHPDFGGPRYGIPITVVPASQPVVPIKFNQYA